MRPLVSTVTDLYVPAVTPVFASVTTTAALAVPSNVAEPVASPLRLRVRAVASFVADEALPVSDAVMTLAAKLPEASRKTSVLAWLMLTAFEVTVGLPARPSPFVI